VIQIRHILCPVDLSAFSERALVHAGVLARWYEAELVAVHVIPHLPTIYGLPGLVAIPSVAPDAEAVRAEVERFVRTALAPLAVEIVVRTGAPAQQILMQAAEARADLLVMGTHGRSGFERLMLGSVTEKVLREAACPVLTVPRGAEAHQETALFKRILCGVDFSKASELAATHALSLAQEANGSLTLLYVAEPAPEEALFRHERLRASERQQRVFAEARSRLEKLVPEEARDWCEVDLRLACGKAHREILRIATEEHADLVVLGMHGHDVFDEMVFGSTTQHVARRAPCPLLTVRY
jgi:nucleotide-binding universal stress UspA family protein